MKELLELFKTYEKLFNEKDRIYHHFLNYETSEYLDRLRGELLQHLAGNIVVKEHRLRYQKEQFDRYTSSLYCNALHKNNITLHEFCTNYAYLIEMNIGESHNGRSPKIDANYDDFSEKTIRPINSTIFYYFFSMDSRKKTIAQWLLSAVRFPN